MLLKALLSTNPAKMVPQIRNRNSIDLLKLHGNGCSRINFKRHVILSEKLNEHILPRNIFMATVTLGQLLCISIHNYKTQTRISQIGKFCILGNHNRQTGVILTYFQNDYPRFGHQKWSPLQWLIFSLHIICIVHSKYHKNNLHFWSCQVNISALTWKQMQEF